MVIGNHTALMIYAGYSNTAFLNANDELYIFGSNWDGRCMLPDLCILSTPHLALRDRI